MANAANTGSTLTLPGAGGNKTSTSLSTNMIIKVGGVPIGAIQSLSINEQRNIAMIDEVGNDGHIDSTPNKSTEISGSCKRIRYDRLRIAEAFSRSFVHAASQVYPFDIEIFDVQKRDPANQIVTVIKNVWIKSISTAYDANDWVISDNMDWVAETIFSFSGSDSSGDGGVSPAAQGGERGLSAISRGLDASVYNIEQAVDRGLGGRRGSMDVSGIIDLTGNLF